MQLAILMVEELSTAVGRALEEVIQRLVVLHQIRLTELTLVIVIGQELEVDAVSRICFVSSEIIISNLTLEDIRTQFLGGICLRVFFQRQQFVLTENG